MRAALGASISPSTTTASSSRFMQCQRSAKNSAWLNPQHTTSRTISRAAGRGWQGSAASSTLHCSTVAACLCRVTSFGGRCHARDSGRGGGACARWRGGRWLKCNCGCASLPGVALLLLLIDKPAQVLVTHVLQLRVAEGRQDVLKDAGVVAFARVAEIPLLNELRDKTFANELGECRFWMGRMQDVVDGRPVGGACADHLVGESARLVLVRQFRDGSKSHGLARPILIEGHVPDLAVDVDVSDGSLECWGVRAGCQ